MKVISLYQHAYMQDLFAHTLWDVNEKLEWRIFVDWPAKKPYASYKLTFLFATRDVLETVSFH
jgi:hypothetical protein